ncbi:PIN domain-containing protein [uncultured Arthrobacter sp.]|uniref:PIN domain-containing protein n=1 Tax=uncultured Arthrobacter sp. TaxID=114050 RepID=UPI0032173905
MSVTRGLLDTSVFIAEEVGRELRATDLPEVMAVSVITVGELTAGVLSGSDALTTGRRLRTLDRVNQFVALPIDVSVATEWARLRVRLAEAGRRVAPNDLWIAATAVVHALPLFTQDADFDPLDGISGLVVVRV